MEQIENKSCNPIPYIKALIDAKVEILRDFNLTLSSARENLESVETKWVNRCDVNRQLTTKYDRELVTLGQTVAALERNGITKWLIQ